MNPPILIASMPPLGRDRRRRLDWERPLAASPARRRSPGFSSPCGCTRPFRREIDCDRIIKSNGDHRMANRWRLTPRPTPGTKRQASRRRDPSGPRGASAEGLRRASTHPPAGDQGIAVRLPGHPVPRDPDQPPRPAHLVRGPGTGAGIGHPAPGVGPAGDTNRPRGDREDPAGP